MSDPNPKASTTKRKLSEDCSFAPDVYNEMCHKPGELRPHWNYFGQSLDSMGHDELIRRYREARRLIRDNDVTYNVYSDPQGMGRPWDLDLIPLLIGSDEWSHIEAGLIQRAELLNLMLADLYGPRKLIEKGIIPPELVYAYPSYLRPCHGIERDDGRFLHLYAADLARSADGEFTVIADRTQAPSGAGYALENRIVLSRVLPSLFRDSHVHRLAPFFRVMRNTLNSLAANPVNEPRIVLLSPGVDNESYFEHAYLANYLGYTLVQGGDLTVRDGRVWLKTLDSLQQVDVILRRVDDEYCDPLELREDSFLGVPGLLQVVREGNVTIANSLGSGVLQNAALMAYMPEVARYFFGEDLRLPTVKTWWCGREEDKKYVLANLETLVIKPFYPGSISQRTIFGAKLTEDERNKLAAQINAKPQLFTAQLQVTLSAAPVLLQNASLDSRHIVIRSYLVAHDKSFIVMPGALTRVSTTRDTYMVSNQLGGTSKDTWVLASEPEKQDTLIKPVIHASKKMSLGGHVSSRVADNLFWLGRYAERAEGLVRLLRVIQIYRADSSTAANAGNQSSYALKQLLRAVTHVSGLYPGFVGKDSDLRMESPDEELLSIITDRKLSGSLTQTLSSLLVSARSVRDRLSMDTLRVVNDIDVLMCSLLGELGNLNDADDEMDNLITALVGFSGLISENMTHEQGWRFLQIGRRLERALHTSSLIRATMVIMDQGDEEDVLLESILSVIDSLMTYKRNFQPGYEATSFLELVLLNETNPRSIGYQLMRIQEHVGYLPIDRGSQQLSREERLILELLTKLRLSDSNELVNTTNTIREQLDQILDHVQKQLSELSNILTTSYFQKDEQIQQLVRMRPGDAE